MAEIVMMLLREYYKIKKQMKLIWFVSHIV